MVEVRTRDEAIALVDQAFQAWSTKTSGVLAQAMAAARTAQQEADRAERKCLAEVSAIEALLAAAGDQQRRQLEASLVRAKENCEKTRRAKARIDEVAVRVASLRQEHATAASPQVDGARASLRAMRQALDGYRSAGTSFDSGGLRSDSAAHRGQDLSAMGLLQLDVDSADLDENPILDDDPARGTFGKGGLTRADYRWAVQTWNDTVGPGVASGKTRDDFAERDARSNAKPLRRTADVYDMFLGTDRIRAGRRADGSLDIVNGRHRLLIARELGIKSLPGQVS